ncbi:MAG: bifunctional folylpolyglutamate synthase/dihydrofolate synthase [Anaerolineae bacterium]|nr:MAG: bifunctional folylpolyglutamate synthase/dihydrofolate synthase [Anaerolineae bacterium]
MIHRWVRSYRDALAYLYSFTDFAKRPAHLYSAEHYDLERMQAVLGRLGSPQHHFKSVHIAGTKGKGSTAAITAAVLGAAGFRTGLYTSPHLHTFCERIRIGRQMIPRRVVTGLVREIAPAVESVPLLTTFEIITALAFLHFARQGVEFAVLEVGLGGRLDATNVIQPRVAAITSLSLDHTYVLGNTVAAIAREKAGIIKPGVPVVSAPQSPEAQAVIEQVCVERRAPLTAVGRDWAWEFGQASLDGQTFRIASELAETADLCQQAFRLPLLGRHQLINATVSIALLHVLRCQGVAISAGDVSEGMARVEWPARFEVLSRDPTVVVDGAHNVDSAQRLRQALSDYFPGRDATLIFGVSGDKDIEGMLGELLPGVRQVVVMQSSHPRAAPVEDLLPIVTKLGQQAYIAEDADRALDMALGFSAPGDPICASGSLFVAGDVRLAWFRRNNTEILPMADAHTASEGERI